MSKEAAAEPLRVLSHLVEIAGWHCQVTVDMAGQDAELCRLFGRPVSLGKSKPRSEICVRRQSIYPELHWRQQGELCDLGLFLRSPEGSRFVPENADPNPAYFDSVLGRVPALRLTDGALQVLQPDRWRLYLDLILTWLLLREAALTSFHAAVCVAAETTLVLLGSSGSGKSTLSAALAAQNAEFYGDEYVFFDARCDRLSTLPKTLGLRPGGLELLNTAPAGRWYEAKPNDPKYSVPLPAPIRQDLPERTHFYFLDGFALTPALRPAPAGDMVRRLLRGMGHGEAALAPRLETAARAATRFPAWLLTPGKPDETARLLLAHAQGKL